MVAYKASTCYSIKTSNGNAVTSALKASDTKNSEIKTIMLASTNNSRSDVFSKPDYMVQRNADAAKNLLAVVKNIIKNNQ